MLNLKTNPKLLALIDKAKSHVMTKEERNAQRKSWVIGNFLIDHPELTREYAETIYNKVEGF
jgi:predicted transglutaminase-like protease